MHEIAVRIRDKIAQKTCETVYVCGNSDFVINFDFDEEWNAHEAKTARFDKKDGTFVDIVFTGNVCNMPILSNVYGFNVGVFAGNLRTTTPAYVPAKKSILCGSGVPDDPAPDVYAQIMARLNELENGEITPEQIAQAVEDYLRENPVGGVSSEEVKKAIDEALQAAKENGKFDCDVDATLTKDGTAADAGATGKAIRKLSEEIVEIKNTDIPDYWENAVESAIRKVENYQDKGGVDVCTFGFITDTHTDVNNSGVFARLMGRVMDACKIPMCMHGGDYIAGSAIISKENLIKQHAHNDYIFRNIEDKLLTAQGNHESVFGVNANYDSNLTNAEIYDYVFRKNQSKLGIVFGDTGTYFYKDIPAQKVRYIVLNCYEFETEMDNNQVVISNNKLRTSKFGVAQLTWFAEVALDVPENYSIVVCSHNAPYRRTDLPQAWLSETTFMIDCDVTLGLINAYRNKTSYTYSGSLGSGTTLEAYDLSFDFSQRKGEIACWVAGHTHMDGIFDIDGLKVVTTANCSGHIAVTDAPEKVPGTDTEYIMDFFCINKKTRECNVVRLGATLEKGDDGEIIVVNNKADTDSDDWVNNKRINQSKELLDGDGYAISNFIPFTFGGIINFAGFEAKPNHTNVVFYKADTTTPWSVISYSDAYEYMYSISDNVISLDTSIMRNPGTAWNDVAYIRVSAPLSGTLDDVAITINEDIRFEPNGNPEGVRSFDY